jgi:hypothetical protein
MQLCSLSLVLAGASLSAGGCGGKVIVDDAGNSSTPTTSTTSGGMSCLGVLNLKLDGAKGGTLLTSLCDTNWNPLMSTTPSGYLLEGGPPPGGVALRVDACTGPNAGSQGVHIDVPGANGTGKFMGAVTYMDGHGGIWKAGSAPITIGVVGAVGQYIQGSVITNVTGAASGTHALNVEFSVCHLPDEQSP